MQRQDMINCWILWMVFFQTTSTFEIFLEDENGKNSSVQSYVNGTYQMPLFQTRYITVRINADNLRRNRNLNEKDIVGFKLQAQSTDARVIEIEKELITSNPRANNKQLKKILVEDLFILSKKNALGHIFNVYPSPTIIPMDDQQLVNIVWSMRSVLMEETNLTIRLDLFYDDDTSSSYFSTLNVLVTQPKRLIDRIFFIVLPVIVIFISIQMGILLDTKILLDLVKKPKPVLIGFIAQYGMMPFLAMGIAKVFRYSTLHSLALFVIGCCPGSGASNQWTLLFDGDVNLSAVMSFVSTASSFFMMPLYFYTLGRIYTDELSIRVPFLGLVRSLALVVVPYTLGIGISHFSPRTRALVETMVKPMMLFLLIFFLVFGTIVNWYMILMIDLRTALTAPLLPYLGFLLGALLAWICRLKWTHVKTIGIEAGIQNTGIAFMIMFYSFPQPYAAKATIVPLVVAFLTTKPFWLVYMIRNQVKKYQKKKIESDNPIDSTVGVTADGQTACSTTKQVAQPIHKKEDLVEMRQNL